MQIPVSASVVHPPWKASYGYLQVDYWETVPVCLADDAVEVLESGGQEGPESALHPDGLSLGEAHEIGAVDAPHGASLRAVQSDEVELWRNVNRSKYLLCSSEILFFCQSGFIYPWP